MKNEFKVKKYKDATVYTLESATSGGTSAGSVASVSDSIGGVRRRGDNLIAQEEKKEAPKPRNFVAKNAKMGGAGQHKDKKKEQKQGVEKHKKPYMESLKGRLQELQSKIAEIKANPAYLRAAERSRSQARDTQRTFGKSPEEKAAARRTELKRDAGIAGYSKRYNKEHPRPEVKSQPAPKHRDPNIDRSDDYSTWAAGRRDTVSEGSSDFIGNAIEDLRASKPGLDIESFLDELYYYIDAEYGKRAADMVADAGKDQHADWYDSYTDMAEDHSTATTGYGQGSGSTGQAFAGRMKGAIPEDAYTQKLMSSLENLNEDWQKANRRDKTDGMSRKAVKAYRRENPGSKLKTAVTTKPSKLKKGGKAAKRRKSFCARMSGNKGPMKKPNGKPTPKALALRRWNCEEDAYMNSLNAQVLEKLNPQAPVDTWVQDFQKADPNKYKQFKDKTPQKKAQMAAAAHYAANEPSKKK
jgi:hypothetical protein